MTRRFFRLALASAMLSLLCAATAAAQDFQKTYKLAGGGQIHIGNVSGDVKVTGYGGDAVIVKGFKEGEDRDRVDVEDLSTEGRIEIRAHYPKRCDCQASIRFEVQVPSSIKYDFERVSSVSGNVEVSQVAGRVHATSVSGNVEVHGVSGSVNAKSVSGNVEVEINRLDGTTDDMKFSSVSGNVSVRMPSEIDADVDMSSLSGGIHTDFPIEVTKDRYGPRTSARGKLGNGSRRLQMSSVSGSLSLRRS
ncbi:MAG TPA: DUF4097 family beta strand repeat-containing protein [Blastocatellia bacterium]|nr:DUF4097 family beta strand repeat-containing protein [Blastocatellia bacterium]